MTPMPALKTLQEANPEGFTLALGNGQRIALSLLEVQEGIALDANHECYSALFALPLGVQLPQALFHLYGPDCSEPWLLMMTPVLPEPDGRYVLEAVIHRPRRQATGKQATAN